MICVKTFKKLSRKDFDTWQDWLDFVTENIRYCREESTINDFEGKCKDSDLPSEHPYWKQQIRNQWYETMLRHIKNLNQCIKDPNKIKFLYNSNTTLTTIKEKISKCKKIIEDYDRMLIE
jgi:hypothetical protein